MTPPDEHHTELRRRIEKAAATPHGLITLHHSDIAALLDDNRRMRSENAELDAHAEYMSRALPGVQQNIDDWRAEAESCRAALTRVHALRDQLERESRAGGQYAEIRRTHVARLTAALEAPAPGSRS